MEFNVAIFAKNCQQQMFPWTTQLTQKKQSDPFLGMHFDKANCVYQQVITGLSDDFTQDLAFPAFYHHLALTDVLQPVYSVFILLLS